MTQTIDDLEAVLSEEMEVLRHLIDCLKSERESIVNFDLKAMTEAYKIKYQKILQIKMIETSRRDLLKKLGQPLEEVLKSTSQVQAERIRHSLSCVRSMAQVVQEFNEIQKQYIAYSLYNVQSSLALMEALQGKGSVRCYDEKGTMASQGSQSSQSSIDARVMSRSV